MHVCMYTCTYELVVLSLLPSRCTFACRFVCVFIAVRLLCLQFTDYIYIYILHIMYNILCIRYSALYFNIICYILIIHYICYNIYIYIVYIKYCMLYIIYLQYIYVYTYSHILCDPFILLVNVTLIIKTSCPKSKFSEYIFKRSQHIS